MLSVVEKRYFQFGAGPVVKSQKSWVYPVGLHGKRCLWKIAEVPGDCSGLVSAEDMGRFGIVFDFGKKRVRSRGVERKMTHTESGHPTLQLLDFAPAQDPEESWKQHEPLLKGMTKESQAEPYYIGDSEEEATAKRASGAFSRTTPRPSLTRSCWSCSVGERTTRSPSGTSRRHHATTRTSPAWTLPSMSPEGGDGLGPLALAGR